MPALQVRDFPDDLYEELRVFSALHHRSMAQQTIAAVEAVIREESPRANPLRVIPFESPAEREGRLAKRREILERAGRRRARFVKGTPSPLSMLSEARNERDEDFDRVVEEVVRSGL